MDKSIRLYTQPNCGYCDIMKTLLDKTGYTYYTINIAEVVEAKQFLKEAGHNTVPQLYVKDIHINTQETQRYTSAELSMHINAAMDNDWPAGNGDQEF